ncbi:hypothetical protein ABMA28_003476 [Loxostege sticticalis]|uniref:DDE Tnp4 domain-containing protein n=1 Tax=Loxostege sticticalis TaxID=481309 RepID=A0ABD0SYW6_LOXSC
MEKNNKKTANEQKTNKNKTGKAQKKKPKNMKKKNQKGSDDKDIDIYFLSSFLFLVQKQNGSPYLVTFLYYTPENFEIFKNTKTIIDSTEATFSNHKTKNTIKFLLVGASPGGLISYCSDGYGGATSDRQLIERSPLTKLCQAGDVIMADKGFNFQDIFASKNVAVKIPTFLRGSSQLSTYDLRKDRELSKRRVHITRLIGLTKTYTILKSEMNSYYVPLTSKIIFLCVMLCSFKERIVFQFK